MEDLALVACASYVVLGWVKNTYQLQEKPYTNSKSTTDIQVDSTLNNKNQKEDTSHKYCTCKQSNCTNKRANQLFIIQSPTLYDFTFIKPRQYETQQVQSEGGKLKVQAISDDSNNLSNGKSQFQENQLGLDIQELWKRIEKRVNLVQNPRTQPRVEVVDKQIFIRCPLQLEVSSYNHMQLVRRVAAALSLHDTKDYQRGELAIDVKKTNFTNQYALYYPPKSWSYNQPSMRVEVNIPRRNSEKSQGQMPRKRPSSHHYKYSQDEFQNKNKPYDVQSDFHEQQQQQLSQGESSGVQNEQEKVSERGPEMVICFDQKVWGQETYNLVEHLLDQYSESLVQGLAANSKGQETKQSYQQNLDESGQFMQGWQNGDRLDEDFLQDPFALLNRQIRNLDRQFQQFGQTFDNGSNQFFQTQKSFGSDSDSDSDLDDDENDFGYGFNDQQQLDKSINSQGQIEKQIQKLGAKIYFPEIGADQINWGVLAGYHDQKQLIEESVLLPLNHPEVFDKISKKTRLKFQANRPRAILFEGPPGTGKTTSARVISTQAALPLVYIPLESIMSKFYGESEQKLASIFEVCEKMGGCIVFLDEIDSLATGRGPDMHEATRRLLGVLLRWIDGFEGQRKTLVIGATNRRDDLDNALISRFDTIINFGLPDLECRHQIISHFAQHLDDAQLQELARNSQGLSGRDLRDVCELTERAWAAKIIKGITQDDVPTVDEYLKNINLRQQVMRPSKLSQIFG